MQVVARQKQDVVSRAKASCEDLVKQIVQDKRVAQEQEKQVNAEAEKIGKEAAEADEIARVVQGELDKALPALQAAEDALNVLTKKDISELKAYAKPPGLVEITLQGAMHVPLTTVCLSALYTVPSHATLLCCSQLKRLATPIVSWLYHMSFLGRSRSQSTCIHQQQTLR